MPETTRTDPFGMCQTTTKLYEVHGEDARCSLVGHHNGPHQTNLTPDRRDANIVSWDNETRPQCRAVLALEELEYRCWKPENHADLHRDDDGDTWDITYVDAPAKPLGERMDHLLLGNLSRRVRELDAAWTVGGETLSERLDRVFLGAMEEIRTVANRVSRLEGRLNPVCGHRDPSGGLVCQRPPDHYGEVHRDVPDKAEGTWWTTGHSSAEHRAAALTPAQPPENEAVLIDPVELGKLLKASERLDALEAAGVDNWSGYDDALNGVGY